MPSSRSSAFRSRQRSGPSPSAARSRCSTTAASARSSSSGIGWCRISTILFPGTRWPAAMPCTSPGCDPAAVRAARAARVLVATPRALTSLRTAAVEIDVLVGSGSDEGERYRPGDLVPPPRAVVRTEGGLGGWYERADGSSHALCRRPAPRTDRGCVRVRRQLRSGLDVRARRWLVHGRRACPRGTMRGLGPDRSRSVRRPAPPRGLSRTLRCERLPARGSGGSARL